MVSWFFSPQPSSPKTPSPRSQEEQLFALLESPSYQSEEINQLIKNLLNQSNKLDEAIFIISLLHQQNEAGNTLGMLIAAHSKNEEDASSYIILLDKLLPHFSDDILSLLAKQNKAGQHFILQIFRYQSYAIGLQLINFLQKLICVISPNYFLSLGHDCFPKDQENFLLLMQKEKERKNFFKQLLDLFKQFDGDIKFLYELITADFLSGDFDHFTQYQSQIIQLILELPKNNRFIKKNLLRDALDQTLAIGKFLSYAKNNEQDIKIKELQEMLAISDDLDIKQWREKYQFPEDAALFLFFHDPYEPYSNISLNLPKQSSQQDFVARKI